jgi:hypothetical protein
VALLVGAHGHDHTVSGSDDHGVAGLLGVGLGVDVEAPVGGQLDVVRRLVTLVVNDDQALLLGL